MQRVRYATVISSDGFSNLADTVFDVIVTNHKSGEQAAVYRFDDAKEHLSSNGRLYVVMGKKQGASAERHSGVFGNCRQLAREGFWILRCDL